jgi:hypothetical protein
MPSVLAQSIADKAILVLQDAGNTRWTLPEILGWINAGQKEIVIAKPDACTVTKAVQLASGTRQILGAGATADAVMLLRLQRNMGVDGLTPGSVVTIISGEQLDALSPDWHAEPKVAAVEHYVYDPRVPLQYYVYPPSNGSGYVEATYSAVPAAIASLAGAITISDIFENALVDYVLYRCFAKDSEMQEQAARAVAHYQAFSSAIGANTQNLGSQNPNQETLPLNPGVPAGAK